MASLLAFAFLHSYNGTPLASLMFGICLWHLYKRQSHGAEPKGERSQRVLGCLLFSLFADVSEDWLQERNYPCNLDAVLGTIFEMRIARTDARSGQKLGFNK